MEAQNILTKEPSSLPPDGIPPAVRWVVDKVLHELGEVKRDITTRLGEVERKMDNLSDDVREAKAEQRKMTDNCARRMEDCTVLHGTVAAHQSFIDYHNGTGKVIGILVPIGLSGVGIVLWEWLRHSWKLFLASMRGG